MSPIPKLQCEYVDQLLLFLSRKDIRTLVLEFDDVYSGFEVHSSMYSCKYLTHLELHVYTIPPPPTSFKGFLFLRSLYLEMAKMSSSTIESTVAHSPLLEKLTLIDYEDMQLTIRALKLKYFYFRLYSEYCRLSLYTPLLEELKGGLSEIKYFSIGVETLVFRHLRIINLSYVPFDDEDVTPAVIRLITGSPNLHKLEISNWPYGEDDAPELACVSFSDTDFTYGSLKVIKMMDFGGNGINEMKLIRFLLERSPVLEKMIYKPHSSLSDKNLQNVTVQLLSCRRASANAEIVIEIDK